MGSISAKSERSRRYKDVEFQGEENCEGEQLQEEKKQGKKKKENQLAEAAGQGWETELQTIPAWCLLANAIGNMEIYGCGYMDLWIL